MDCIKDESVKIDLRTVLEEADMARFAPSADIAPDKLYNKAVELIQKTEDLKA